MAQVLASNAVDLIAELAPFLNTWGVFTACNAIHAASDLDADEIAALIRSYTVNPPYDADLVEALREQRPGSD
jgi:hypothetical protein